MDFDTGLLSLEKKKLSTGERIEEIFRYILSVEPLKKEEGRHYLSLLKNRYELQELALRARDRDFQIKYYTIEQLGKFEYDITIKELINFLSDENLLIQRKAEKALEQIELVDKYDYLIPFLKEGTLQIRLYSIKTLGKSRQVNAVLPLLDILDDKEEKIRYEVIDALRLIGDERADSYMIKYLSDDTGKVRYAACIYCGTCKVKAASSLLFNLLNDKEPKIRAAAAWATGQIEDITWIDRLQECLVKEQNGNVRNEILKAIYRSGRFNSVKSSLKDEIHSTKAISDWYFTVTSGEKEKQADICLFIEGSYPFIAGGVSSWVRDLLAYFHDLTFSIVSISPSSAEIREFKHEFPANVLYYTDINIYDLPDIHSGRKNNVKGLHDILVDFIKSIDSQKLEDFEKMCHTLAIPNNLNVTVHDLLFSREAWSMIHKFYEDCSELPFLEFYWSYRAMLLPVYNILNARIPSASMYYTALTGYAALASVLARVCYKKPLMLTEHGIYHRERMIEINKTEWIYQMKDEGFVATEMFGGLKKLWIGMYQTFSSLAYKFSDRITTLSGENSIMQIESGANPEKIVIIPNGIDTTEFEHIKQKDITTRDRLTIALVGRVVQIKDIKTFIWAAKYVHDKMPDRVNFLIMGSCDEETDYVNECMSLKSLLCMDRFLEFTGNVDLREYFNRIDLLVLTSISEGQPLSLMEAMTCGIPCVSTNVGSCNSLINGKNREDEELGSCGIITKVHSPYETAGAIIKILSEPELYNQMSQTGKKRIKNNYQRKDVFNLYGKEFKRFLNKEE